MSWPSGAPPYISVRAAASILAWCFWHPPYDKEVLVAHGRRHLGHLEAPEFLGSARALPQAGEEKGVGVVTAGPGCCLPEWLPILSTILSTPKSKILKIPLAPLVSVPSSEYAPRYPNIGLATRKSKTVPTLPRRNRSPRGLVFLHLSSLTPTATTAPAITSSWQGITLSGSGSSWQHGGSKSKILSRRGCGLSRKEKVDLDAD